MFSFPYDLPCSLDTHDEDPFAPLNFDDLLDIAREFEFTRTITHIWPCEESSPGLETGLEDILAAIVPTPDAEESPLPCPMLSISLDPVSPQEDDLLPVLPAPDVHPSISPDLVHLTKEDDLVRAEIEYPITSMLRGWSPPNGSQFLDLDDSLMSPQDMWVSPWSPMFAPPYTPSVRSVSRSPTTVHVVDGVQPQASKAELRVPSETVEDARPKAAPLASPPVQRAILEPVRAKPTARASTGITPHVKAPKSRVNTASAQATGGHATVSYAKAPRGGIPPHIARTVTKANIIRIEKERKFMQDAFSNTTTGKPSVLRTTVKAEKLCGGGGGKKLLGRGEHNERGGRATKKARV